MFSVDNDWLLSLVGLACGTFIGAIARQQHFCTLSSLERYWYANDSRGVRTWALAGVVALVLTQLLRYNTNIDLDTSIFLMPNFNPVGAIIGGLSFGLGMALVGTCAFGALVRLGGGSLRSLVVLSTLAFSALAARGGILGRLRLRSNELFAIDLSFAGSQSIADIAAAIVGKTLTIDIVLIVAATILFWIYRSSQYRHDFWQQFTGFCIGSAVAFGWWATSYFKQHSFNNVQIESASFVAPPGEILMQIIAFTGRLPDYSMGLTVGVVLGSAAISLLRSDVRWEACDSAPELGRHILGAILMGIGGIFALGCTIGQGISAFSLMAISAPIVLLSILLGARIGLSLLLGGFPLLKQAQS